MVTQCARLQEFAITQSYRQSGEVPGCLRNAPVAPRRTRRVHHEMPPRRPRGGFMTHRRHRRSVRARWRGALTHSHASGGFAAVRNPACSGRVPYTAKMRYPMGAPGTRLRRGPAPAGSAGPAAGDWLSGRAPRSHRGGHWFDPSIAHQVRGYVGLYQRSRWEPFL